MLQNFITIAIRSLRRYRSYVLVNIAGLALGITCGLLVFLLVRFHLSMDNYHAKADRTYRVVSDIHFGDRIQTPGVPYPFGKALRQDFPELESVAQIRFVSNILATAEASGNQPRQKFMLERELAYVEPEFFKTFDYQWIKGNPDLLKEPLRMAITVPMAEKLFGKADPIGKTILLENKHACQVVGLLAAPPANTQFKPSVFVSYASYTAFYPNESLEHWEGVSGNHHCYIVLPKGMEPKQIEARLPAFVKKYQREHEKWEHKLQPLSDMYFNTAYDGDVPKPLIYALVFVGLLLIGTACLNFINLATAQALNRSREVGIRKVLGSSRGLLFRQFLLETSLITFAALLLSVLAVYSTLPYLNKLTHSDIQLKLHDGWLLIFLLCLQIGVTVLAGAYPALVLAGFKPVQALKGTITSQTLGGYSVRRALVLVQFFICQILIIAALVITGQMDYLKNSSLGFRKEAIVLLPVPSPEKTKMEALRRQLLQIPGVKQLSFGYDAPAGHSHNSSNCRFDSRQEDEPWYILSRPGDDQYLPTYGIELVAGRNLQPSDTIREFLLNETAVKKIGLPNAEAAIGKMFTLWDHKAPIVGVVKDFHTKSLREPIEPIVILSQQSDYTMCGVRIDLTNTQSILAGMERIWSELYPDNFYSYAFLDSKIAEFYELENVLLGMAQGFCGIALFIGCLGLFGLVSFMAARRKKEIGVRKVLGASVQQILGLFGKEFIRLIGIAFLLAAPLGWWAMSSWLESYAYRVPLGAGILLIAFGISVFIAFLTVSVQSLRAALANPVDSLRSE